MSDHMDNYPMHHPLYANVNPNRIYYNFGLAYLATPRRHTGPVAVWNYSYMPPKWNYASRLTCRALLGHYILFCNLARPPCLCFFLIATCDDQYL